MKFQLLPSTFDENGRASARQHLACFIINDEIAVDAGSLAMATNELQKQQIRDVVLTHAHLDHTAGLPLFIDDLFATLTEPIRIHTNQEVCQALEEFLFNWTIYPRFSELSNDQSAVMEYKIFEVGKTFVIKDLQFRAIGVNHKVSAVGYIISEMGNSIAMSGDTAEMDEFWEVVNKEKNLKAIFLECAFPDELKDIAENSFHLTPKKLKSEIKKCSQKNCPIYVINLKPMYRTEIVEQIRASEIENLEILEVGRVYNF